MADVSAAEVRRVVRAVLAELAAQSGAPAPPSRPVTASPAAAPAPSAPAPSAAASSPPAPPRREPQRPGAVGGAQPDIDVPDPTVAGARRVPGVRDPVSAVGLENLMASTTARIGVGRAGPRPRTRELLLFQADHAVTQDAIFGEVPNALLEQFDMFAVQTRVSDEGEFLLRPDLGRQLSDEGRALVAERCVKSPQVQLVVGDGLSAAAVENNLAKIYPVITDGLRAAGISMGTPFFVRYCRVGVMNDLNTIIGADVVALLIGERPGLGVADALSVYSGWQPGPGKTDAQRDVVCMITENGGTNPLEAGAYVVEHLRGVLANRASGVELRLAQSGER